MKRFLYIFCFLFFSVAAHAFAPLQETRAVFVPDNPKIAAGTPFYLILKVEIDRGWHVYWRYAGDAGEPVSLDLKLPEGFVEEGRFWSAPAKFMTGPFAEYGYAGDMYLAVKIRPPARLETGRDYFVSAETSWLSCKDECVPRRQRLSTLLTAEQTVEPPPPAVQKIMAQMPVGAASAYWEHENKILLQTDAGIIKGAQTAAFFPYEESVVNTAAQSYRFEDGKIFLTVMPSGRTNVFNGVVVVRDAYDRVLKSFEISAAPSPLAKPVLKKPFAFAELAYAVFLAFLGGLLLNFMPCVLPVLSLKIFSVLKADDLMRKKESLGYTAGVLSSFVIMGAALSGLRAAGGGQGWGFQMQYPPFVLFLAVLMFMAGLLFSGVFTVGNALSCKAGQACSDWGGFGTGLLAVLAATPCAAPFMSVALGYALLAPAAATVIVFFVMGLGLSAPFLAVGFFPKCASFLPKSGAWCETLRQVLAFPLYAAAAWLVWVLTMQAGEFALAVGLTVLLCGAACAWLFGKFPDNKRLAAACWVIFLCVSGASMYAVTPVRDVERAAAASRWKPFDAAEVTRLRKENVPVFVKFSASWCLTCLMNEKTTLETDRVTALFEDKGVALFSADWTTRNDEITAVLETFGRGGVPLYVYYAPHAERPVVLPQILTPSGIETLLKEL